MDMSVALMMAMASWVYTYPKLVKLYMLNMYIFLNVNHTLIKFFFFNLSEEKNFWSPGIVVLDRLNTKYINMKYTL